jgi:hypothetical protein
VFHHGIPIDEVDDSGSAAGNIASMSCPTIGVVGRNCTTMRTLTVLPAPAVAFVAQSLEVVQLPLGIVPPAAVQAM